MNNKPLTEAERRLALPPGALSIRQPLRGGRWRFVALRGRGKRANRPDASRQPTWSVLYRGLIEGLSAQYRCVAVDLAGFGLSVAPRDFSFRPEDQARLVAGLLDRLDLRDATLVAHDWGGPVGLGAAMMTSGRISSLCLGNTGPGRSTATCISSGSRS